MSKYRRGVAIERSIDGMWFGGVIEACDSSAQTVTVVYDDDGNTEENVPFEEIKLFEGDADAKSTGDLSRGSSAKGAKSPGKSHAGMRPLANLVDDDDYEFRASQKVTVTIHESGDVDASEPAIIINGADSKLAVGGGLRALRYLRT
jgi:hypothetical protein